MIKLNDILGELTAKYGLSQQEAEKFAATMFDTILKGLHEPVGAVKVKGLGTFKLTSVSSRESVDVNTGERIIIGGRNKISFSPDTMLKDRVNSPFAQFETVVLNEGVDFSQLEVEDVAETIQSQETTISEIAELEPETEPQQQPEPETGQDSQSQFDPKTESEFQPQTEEKSQQQSEPEIESESQPQPQHELKTESESQPQAEEKPQQQSESEQESNSQPELRPQAHIEQETESKSEKDTDVSRPAPEYIYVPVSTPHHHHHSDRQSPATVKILAATILLLLLAIGFGGYIFLGLLTSRDDRIEQLETRIAQIVDNQKTRPVEQSSPIEQKAPATESQSPKFEKQSPATEKDTKSAEASKVTTEPAPEPQTQYDTDPRIRTGAYVITGIDRELTVRTGQTMTSISRTHLGPGMECYVEAVNGGAHELKAGEKVKLPKLVLKKRLKNGK